MKNPETPLEALLRKEMESVIFDTLSCLKPREKTVIFARFYHAKTLSQTSKEHGICIERTRQIILSALKAMRRSNQIERLDKVCPFQHRNLDHLKTTVVI
jgi:DNA-directed RNA polymerase sigma subunit (sigma70/sigma32)